MTSAPNSAMILVANGPAISEPNSRTRSPSSGRSRRARSRAPLKASVSVMRVLPFLTLPAEDGPPSKAASAQLERVAGLAAELAPDRLLQAVLHDGRHPVLPADAPLLLAAEGRV